MAKKKERSKIDPNMWMNTYSDMVTLLMCFFVMLYAASTPDETKWQFIFQNFTSSGKYINPFVMDEDPNRTNNPDEGDGNTVEPPGDSEEPDQHITNADVPSDFNQLAGWLSATASDSEFADDISVEVSSSGTVTLRFKDSVLFEPNSAELTDEGREAIGMFLPGISAVKEYIGKMVVYGHTAKAISEVNDWDLSGARSSSVLKYVDWKRTVDSEILHGEFYGPHKPIADNDTEEGRNQNRRVEITITRNNNNTISYATMQDILKYDHGIMMSGPGYNNTDVEDQVSQIIDNFESKYNTTVSEEGEVQGNESGPVIPGEITGIPEDVIHEVDEEGNIITGDAEGSSEGSAEGSSDGSGTEETP